VKYEEFLSAVKKTPVYRTAVALEASPSLPVPVVHDGRLFVGLLLFRTRAVGPGRIDILRPEAAIVASWAECAVARFENYNVLAGDSPPAVPVASFPPRTIRDWQRSRYERERESYFQSMPGFRDFVVSRGRDEIEAAKACVHGFELLSEPGLRPSFRRLAPTFARVYDHLRVPA